MLFRSLLLLVGLVVAGALHAVPAWPGLHRITQPDGSTLTCRLVGDEHAHHFITLDGFLLQRDAAGALCYAEALADGSLRSTGVPARDVQLRTTAEQDLLRSLARPDLNALPRPASAPVQARLINYGFPARGNLRGLVLLVEFADNEFQPEYDNALYRRVMNEPGFSDYEATGSVADYFADQSAGLFTPSFDVVGPIKLSKTIQYYGQNDVYGNEAMACKMIEEACRLAHDEHGTDFSLYDYDDNGEVDFVYVIYAGYAESYGASSNTIWPHASELHYYGISLDLDGKHIERYACSSELKFVSGTTLEGIGTFCHEFGHVLGLADLYDTRSANSPQMGAWEVMDVGNYNNNSRTPAGYSAFERASLGWMELTELNEPADDVALEGLITSRKAYRLSTPDENEYFILENRQREGWDAYLPGSGLLITHIDYEPSVWQSNGVNAGVHPRVDLVEADGTQGNGEATDAFPTETNNAFTDFSSPASLTWDGEPIHRGLTHIRVEDGTVHFQFMKERLAAPQGFQVQALADTAFTLEWDEVAGAVAYRVSLEEVLPDSLNPLAFADDFAAMELGGYPKSDYENIAPRLDDFLSQPGWTGQEIYQSGGYARVGSYGQSGSLVSPLYGLGRSEGRATVALRLVSYPGKTVSYTLAATDAEGNELQRFDRKATKQEEALLFHFDCPADAARFVLTTQQERVFLNELRILYDSVAEPEAWRAGPQTWVVDSLATAQFEATGLRPGSTYWVTVQALADEALMSSDVSEPFTIVTSAASTAIRPVDGDHGQAVRVDFFDLSGRRCPASQRGIVLKRTQWADGTWRTEKVVR